MLILLVYILNFSVMWEYELCYVYVVLYIVCVKCKNESVWFDVYKV